ncbi:hypothetical protein FA138_29825, partial [Pseudomonas aeruginosa]|nr:hypothetical protein [Pseudomonas aeruginosa]MCO3695804.1 hypothetical protein [Pseudomonas aeruginosa]MCO3701709.1 hypothetical protein [Pseudomonas aeruginosa]
TIFEYFGHEVHFWMFEIEFFRPSLGQSPGGMPYSNFRTQEAIVSALIAHHSGAMGIAERTLNGKFALARRKIRNSKEI